MERRGFLTTLAAAAGATLFGAGTSLGFASPYRLSFALPERVLGEGLDKAPWNDPGAEAVVPQTAWYEEATRQRWGAWGPPARQYPAPDARPSDPAWLQQRMLYVAGRHLGLDYQHHHVPSWSPPPDWPWIPVRSGRNGRGLDCSNFTSFVTNQALGIKLPTGIGAQARSLVVAGPGGSGSLTLERIQPGDYDEAVRQLQPADLLFIRNDAGKVSHVVFWLGEFGMAPDGVPLILDCHGAGVRAGSGRIPAGVQIRPFRPDNWYGRSFAHAHRIAELSSGTGPAPRFEEGGERDL